MARLRYAKSLEQVFDPCAIPRREHEVMLVDEGREDRLLVSGERCLASLGRRCHREEVIHPRGGPDAVGEWTRKESSHEIGPCRRQLEHRLVHQMRHRVLTPDVEDDQHVAGAHGEDGGVDRDLFDVTHS